jgi:endo-1,4-beta-xylanase
MKLPRLWICTMIAASLPSLANPLPARAQALQQVAGDRMLIGAAVSAHDLDNPQLATLIAEQFGCITAGNEFKPESLQREPGTFTFEPADRIAEFAQQHNMKMIGHTLLWHNQAPAWLFVDQNKHPIPREQALANLKTHIQTVVKHFTGKVVGWDVVNEGISDKDDEYLRDTPARRAIGDDYILKAFEFAHAADPNVQLYYNDYNIENPGKREKALRLIGQIKSAGLRIDAVGIQGHWLLNFAEAKVIDEAITAFSAAGAKVMITELDVDVLPRKAAGADITAVEKQGLDPYKQGLPDEMQQKLAERYAELFKVFAKHPGELTRVTLWGVSDGNTWLNNWPVRGRTNHPMLWDRQLRPKPALAAVIQSLQAGSKSP